MEGAPLPVPVSDCFNPCPRGGPNWAIGFRPQRKLMSDFSVSVNKPYSNCRVLEYRRATCLAAINCEHMEC